MGLRVEHLTDHTTFRVLNERVKPLRKTRRQRIEVANKSTALASFYQSGLTDDTRTITWEVI